MAGMTDLMSAAPPHLDWSAAQVGGALCLRAPGPDIRELNTAFAPVEDTEAVLAHYDGQPHIVCGGPQLAGGGPSYRNIQRAGFEEVGERPNWDPG